MIKKRSVLKITLFIFGSLLLMFPVRETSGRRAFSIVPHNNRENIRVITLKNGKNAYQIKDLTYQKLHLPLTTDVVLSFNYPAKMLNRDDTGNYKLKKAAYTYITGKGSLGKGCAHFYNRNHIIELQTVHNLWLGTCKDLGSFNIEFRFKPYSLKSSSTLFRRVGYFSGKKKGIEIALRNRRITARLYGIFHSPNGDEYDVLLNRCRLIKRGQWYHYSLSFDRITGKLSSLLNGYEEEVVYATASKEPFNGVYEPYFSTKDENGNIKCIDSPRAVIGKNFSGLIDEFRISYLNFNNLEKITEIAYNNYKKHRFIERTPYNIKGIVTSPVYSFQDTGTKIHLFKWEELLAKNTFIWMQFRISDHKFNKSNDNIRWYRIKNHQRKIFLMKNRDNIYLRGKYFQWKAHLISSPDAKRTPTMYDVGLHFQRDHSPNPPIFLSSQKIGNKEVYIQWKKNVDADIYGYKIYYGTNPDKFDGIITHVNHKRINNKMAQGNFITIKIDNELIEENKQRDKKNLLLYPFLNNTVLYFFAVSAYDSYRPNTPYNHESKLSKKVTARPFGGSEIK